MGKMNGVWVGKNSTVIITDDLQIAFFRLKKNLICSFLKYPEFDTYSVVYGHGINWEAKSEAVILKKNKQVLQTSEEMSELIYKHLTDKIIYDDKANKLLYVLFDGTIYENVIAETIDDAIFSKTYPVDHSSSLVHKMQNWNIYQSIAITDNNLSINVHTLKYAICYNVYFEQKVSIYCRFGQHGYCNRGWAMLSTTCLRRDEVRMIDDHSMVLNDYIPNEDYFVTDSCTFPADGGWYWSIKEITDDVISFQGCSGDIYKIYRRI